MDEQYLSTLRDNILVALRKAELELYQDNPLDLGCLASNVARLREYLDKHLPTNPSTHTKELVYGIFSEVQQLLERLANGAELAKQRISEIRKNQEVIRAYTYGLRK